jgi:hypothetical protein
MMLNYLAPDALLHLKKTFPKCNPEYPHIERLPGLTFAYKTKEVLTKNREYPNGFDPYNDGVGEKRVRGRIYRDTSNNRPCEYHGVFILSIERHHPYSYETNDGDTYYRYNITHENDFREPFIFPLVKPGDVFFRLQTWVSRVYFTNPKGFAINERRIPTVVFLNEADRIKYHYIQTQKTFKEAYDYYLPMKGEDPDYLLFCLVNDIKYGFISWTHPFDIMMLFTTFTDEHPVDDPAVMYPRASYTPTDIRDICVKLGLPVAPPDTQALGWMCRSLFAYVGYEY